MSTFKVGDKVTLNPESEFNRGDSRSCNPLNIEGVITNIQEEGLGIYVDWDNDTANCYNAKDLLAVPQGYQLADGSYSSEYQVGDKFVLTGTSGLGSDYSVGDVATLTTNDGSNRPRFNIQTEDERQWSQWILWSDLKAYKENALILTKGDYTTRKEILQYAEDNNLDVQEVYQQLCDAFVDAGAEVGEDVEFWDREVLTNYGWATDNDVYFSGLVSDFTRHLTPEQILNAGEDTSEAVTDEDSGWVAYQGKPSYKLSKALQQMGMGSKEAPQLIQSITMWTGAGDDYTAIEAEGVTLEQAVALLRELKG